MQIVWYIVEQSMYYYVWMYIVDMFGLQSTAYKTETTFLNLGSQNKCISTKT